MANNTVKQSTNKVKIVGILVEDSLKTGTYKDKNNVDAEYISGTLTIRVKQTISGIEEINDIPVNVWVAKLKTNGELNPAYKSMYDAMNSYTSLVACDDESKATKVLMTSANIVENIFSPDGNSIHCTPRITSNFVGSIINLNSYNPEATFTTDMVVNNILDEMNKEGVPTGRLKVQGLVCRYNGTMDHLDYVVEQPDAINYIRSYWKIGDTVQVSGKIRFTTKTEQIQVPVRFGEPVFKTKTINCRELVITADSSDVLTPEQKFTPQEIEAGQKLREQLIEAAKKKSTKAGFDAANNSAKANNPYGF